MSDRFTDTNALDAAQSAYDHGRYEQALLAVRALDVGEVHAVMRLRCLTAYRLGELDEAAGTAQRLVALADRGDASAAARFDVLAVSVVAAGELGRFDQAVEHLRLMQSAATRGGSLADFVRGRGTTATCFALVGDPWAAQRLLSELIGLFQAGTHERRLECTVRANHASVCLQIARSARQGGDAAGCDEALDHAAASLDRTREVAQETGDTRLAAFADVHAAELSLLRGQPAAALTLLDGSVARADGAGLWAHARVLRLLEGEALLDHGDAARARRLVSDVAARLNEGHELGTRIRCHAQMQRVLSAEGDVAGALAQFEQARSLAQFRHYRQSLAQSRYLRARLELEHMYRFRPGQGITPSRPGRLGTR